MSYILDALKKAEAERSPETSGDLYVPPSFNAPSAPHTSARWDRPWIWATAGACIAAAIGVTWFMPDETPSPPAVVPRPAETAVSPMPSVAAAPPAVETKPLVEPDRKPDAGTEVVPPATKPQQVEESRPVKTPAKKLAGSPADHRNKKKPAAPKPAEQIDPTVITQNELPRQVQQELPPLSVNGYLYSNNRADRSVLINNKLLREGEEIAPGFVVEKMTPNGMVLNYKGYRYRTGY